MNIQNCIIYDENILKSLPNEFWLPVLPSIVPNVNEYYYISTNGRIWSTKIGKSGGLMKINSVKNGYQEITLTRKNYSSINLLVHRLVMLTFKWIHGCESLDINHIDGDKSNNNITNLEWVSHSANIYHAYKIGKVLEKIILCVHIQSIK